MDLVPNQAGWLLLTSEQRAPQRWRSQITAVQASGQRLSQTPQLSFEAALPAWSLASDGTSWWVGLGHPAFQPETTPGQCSAADQLSGIVVAISPASQSAKVSIVCLHIHANFGVHRLLRCERRGRSEEVPANRTSAKIGAGISGCGCPSSAICNSKVCDASN